MSNQININRTENVLGKYLLSKDGLLITPEVNNTKMLFENYPLYNINTHPEEMALAIQYAEAISPQEEEKLRHHEGAIKQITINAYERNEKVRNECIKKNGTICVICGQSLADAYGNELLRNKIHVHHIIPISQIKVDYIITADDLVPVCPNCHFVLHSKGNSEVYSLDDVRAMYKRAHK